MGDTSREAVEAWGVRAVKLSLYDFSATLTDGFQVKPWEPPAWFVCADAYAALLAENDALKAERDEALAEVWHQRKAFEPIANARAERDALKAERDEARRHAAVCDALAERYMAEQDAAIARAEAAERLAEEYQSSAVMTGIRDDRLKEAQAEVARLQEALPPRKARWIGDDDVLPTYAVVDVLARDDVGEIPVRYSRWVRWRPDESRHPVYRSCDACDLEELPAIGEPQP